MNRNGYRYNYMGSDALGVRGDNKCVRWVCKSYYYTVAKKYHEEICECRCMARAYMRIERLIVDN